MIYKVLKECVIEGDYFKIGDKYGPSMRMPDAILDTLLGHGFLEPYKIEGWAIKIKLPARIKSLLQVWVAANDNPIEYIHISNYRHGKPDSDGFYEYCTSGYVNPRHNDNTVAIQCQFRSRHLIEELESWPPDKDYRLEELGIMPGAGMYAER